MFAKKLCVKTFQVKNVPLTLTLSLDLKTSILIVDGFLYHITEDLGVDVSLVMIRVILKKGGIMLLQDTFAKFHFCAIFGHILAYILVHIQLILTKFCIHGSVIWRWGVLFLLQSTFNNIPKTALKLKTDKDTLTVII